MGIAEWFERRRASRQQPQAPDGLDRVRTGMEREVEVDEHSAAVRDRPPPPLPGRGPYKVVDVPGEWERGIAGSAHFEEVLKQIPFGPVLVTARFEPNEHNKYGIALYVDGRQCGWLATEWVAKDPSVKFMRRLDEAGILPRFQGTHRFNEFTNYHIVNFKYPGRNDPRLGDIARRITGEPAKPRRSP